VPKGTRNQIGVARGIKHHRTAMGSTVMLRWLELYLSATHYFAADGLKTNIIRWNSAGATLCISNEDQPEIELRLEREIVDVLVTSLLEICFLACT
jgi:hypothetical protein